MALHLTGKGSILDAIGGAAKTAGNAVVGTVKDVGDVANLGAAEITGNKLAASNAESAIDNNYSNLSGKNLGSNISSLGGDVIKGAVNPVVRPAVALGVGLGQDFTGTGGTSNYSSPVAQALYDYGADTKTPKVGVPYKIPTNLGSLRELAGNAAQIGVNAIAAGKGSALEHGVEGTVTKSLGDGVLAKTAARIVATTATGATYGAGSGAAQAIASAQSPDEAIKNILKGGETGAAIGGALGGVSRVPALATAAKENALPLDEAGGINNPTEPNIPESAEDNIHTNNPGAPPDTVPTGEPEPVAPDTADFNQSTRAAQELDHDMQDPNIDWTKVQGSTAAAQEALKAKAATLQSMDASLKEGTKVKVSDGTTVRTSEHTPFYRKIYEDKDHAPRKIDYLQEADRQLRSGSDEESINYQNLLRHAKAEHDIDQFQLADKQSGYNRAKYQIPKGVPAKKFIQALWDKTHSPEFANRAQVGQRLQDVRTTLQGTKLLRDRADKEYRAIVKKGSNADEVTIRAKAAELRSQNTRYNILKAQEKSHALAYRQASDALNEAHPDITLGAKKGVRLTTPGNAYEEAKPIPSTPKIAEKSNPEASTDEPYNLEDVLGHKLDHEAYTGENLNEDAFDPKEMARLQAEQDKAPIIAEPRNLDGDSAILEGIKNGDSDADIVKAYQKATGATEAEAKKAYGVVEEDPSIDKAGAVENNPYHGKLAHYKIDTPKKGILVRSKTVRNRLINKALLRSNAYGDHLAYKLNDANHLWTKLGNEDKALADKLRGHSIESVAKDAKDPKAFAAYANRAKDIEDYIHAARAIADPKDAVPYRQNYGAGFHLQNETGEPSVIDRFRAKDPLSRNFNDYADIEAGSGLKRSTQDFHEDLTKDVIGAQNHIAPNSLFYGLKQAFGNQVSEKDPTTTAPVPLKDFPEVYASKEIAARINTRANYTYDDDKIGSALKAYDTLNQSMKDVKLSLGGFHNINEILNQAALNPAGTAAAGRALVDPKAFRDQMNKWDADGTMEKALHSGLTLGGGTEFGDHANLINKGKYNPVRVAHDALFGRQIPFSKMQVFQRYTKNLDLNNPADYDKMRGVARGINNTFGGINRLVDGLSPTRMKQFSRVVLAEDYNEGQIRTLLTALDPTRLTTTEGRMARQVVIGRAAILATPGVAQAIINNKIGSKPEQIAKFVAEQLVNPTLTTGFKTKGGTPKKISLIAGIVNKTDRAIAPAFNKNNPNKLSGLESEASGNLAPAASLAEEEKANSDYYGNPMHGKGMNVAEDIGAAANAGAPIPFSPAARVLVNSDKNAAKSPVVKILTGGQQGISAGEAAIDTSGIGRVSADTNAPIMQIMNNRELVRSGLSKDDQGALDSIHPSWNPTSSKVQQAAVYNNPNYEINKWTTLADNRNVFNALKSQNTFAVAHGQPSTPLFDLNTHQQAVVIRYEQLKASDPGSDANDTAAVIYADNKNLINKFENDTSTYENKENALYQKTGGLEGDNSPQITPGGVPYPKVTPATQNLVNQYYKITDSTKRADFITANPEINQYFSAMNNYHNAQRASLNEPLLKNYPEPSTALNTWITNYTAASKADRKAMSDDYTSSQYKDMGNYFAKVDEYNLSLTAGQAKFQGQNLSQSNLKDVYDLGQYDIAQVPGADGNDTYEVNPEQAYTDSGSGSSRSSYGTSSKTEYLIQKLENDLAYHDIHETVHDAGKAAKTRKIYVKKYYGKKVAIRKAPTPQKITIKSKPTA